MAAEHGDQPRVGDGRGVADDRHLAVVDEDRAGGVAADGDGVDGRIAGGGRGTQDNDAAAAGVVGDADGQRAAHSGERGGDRRQDAAIQQLEAAQFDRGTRRDGR